MVFVLDEVEVPVPNYLSCDPEKPKEASFLVNQLIGLQNGGVQISQSIKKLSLYK